MHSGEATATLSLPFDFTQGKLTSEKLFSKHFGEAAQSDFGEGYWGEN